MAQSSRKKTMKALSFLLVSLLFIPLLQTEMAYPQVFYVSITRVKSDLSRTVLDISVRIFTDDLEEAILADQTRRLSLLRAKKKLNREDFVKDYIESRLAFQINGTPRDLIYIDMVDELDATSVLLQINNVNKINTIEVENSILIDLFDTQANIMRFEVENQKKYINLSKRITNGTVQFSL